MGGLPDDSNMAPAIITERTMYVLVCSLCVLTGVRFKAVQPAGQQPETSATSWPRGHKAGQHVMWQGRLVQDGHDKLQRFTF